MPIGHAVEFGSGDVVPATVICNDLMSTIDHSRSQLIDHDLNATLSGGDAFMPNECNLQRTQILTALTACTVPL